MVRDFGGKKFHWSCDLEEVKESMRSWEQNPFISYEYESLRPQ